MCGVVHRNLGKGIPLRAPVASPRLWFWPGIEPVQNHPIVSPIDPSSEGENDLSPPTPPPVRTCSRSITDQESLQAPPIPPWPCHGNTVCGRLSGTRSVGRFHRDQEESFRATLPWSHPIDQRACRALWKPRLTLRRLRGDLNHLKKLWAALQIPFPGVPTMDTL